MPDLSTRPAVTTIATTDLVHLYRGADGTTADKKITLANFFGDSTAQTALGILTGSGGVEIGNVASAVDGAALGAITSATSGGAVGYSANTTTGGAVGDSANSTTGFAGGANANASASGAIQLGSGTNSTANTIQFLSSNSVTETQFGYLSTATAFGSSLLDDADAAAGRATLEVGKIVTNSKAAAYTVGTDDSLESYGGVIYVTASATITLPAVADGMNVTFLSVGAITITIDPNASDLIMRDGTAQADGVTIVSPGASGDVAVLTYYDSTGWYASTNSWTQGS
jgi:hypothetical protein